MLNKDVLEHMILLSKKAPCTVQGVFFLRLLLVFRKTVTSVHIEIQYTGLTFMSDYLSSHVKNQILTNWNLSTIIPHIYLLLIMSLTNRLTTLMSSGLLRDSKLTTTSLPGNKSLAIYVFIFLTNSFA